MLNKADKLVLFSDDITNKIRIGRYQKRDGNLLEIDYSRELTEQEIYRYFEMFLKFFLDEITKDNECSFENVTENVYYEIKRRKGDNK